MFCADIDAAALAPHIAAHEFPGQAIACELYLRGGVRSVEIGSLMFGGADAAPAPIARLAGGAEAARMPAARLELVRLAIPRRAFTQSHIDYVAEVVADVARVAPTLRGMRIVKQPQWLRHFTAVLAPL